MCVSFYYTLTLEKAVTVNRILNSDSLFTGLIGTKKLMNGVYKTNIACSFIQGMAEKYCTLCKTQPGPTIHLGNDNLPPFPSWAVNVCILAL